MSYRRILDFILGCFPSITDDVLVNMLPALDVNHCVDECDDLFLIGEIQLRIRSNLRKLAHGINVLLSVVFICWCPCCYDLGNGCALVVADISTHQHHASAHAIKHADELFKVGVVWFSDFAQPYIADADIERVIVADAARENLLHCCCRNSSNSSWSSGAICTHIEPSF